MGVAFINNRLCLLGDFDKHVRSDSSLTVSRYDTTGSDFYYYQNKDLLLCEDIVNTLSGMQA